MFDHILSKRVYEPGISMSSSVTIYHNPRCSKSRQTLDILQQKGHQVTVIKYLQTPPSEQELMALLSQLGLTARQMMRTKEPEYKHNNMADAELSEPQLIALMHQFPKVIERPIVVNGDKAVIGRPPENVFDIL